MCQQLSTIQDVVTDYVNDNKLFTAFDVTKEVRSRTRDRVLHGDVKRDVHNMFAAGSMFGYNRTLANLTGVNPQPWIYHPLAVDSAEAIDTYNGQAVVFVPPVALAPVVTPVTDSITSVVDNSGDSVDALDAKVDGFHLDSTDRLCVPAKLVREMGWKSGDTIRAASDNNELVLFQDSTCWTTPALTHYTVDGYDNIRISAGTLLKAGLTGVSYEIKRDGGQKIKVKKYA